MYEEFFGLRARPFGITPSADLFFHSSAHRRALACLRGYVLAGEPLIVLTGEIGAGKTTLLQVLLRNLPDKFAPATVVSTHLDEVELTRSALLAFGADAAGATLDDLTVALRSHVEDLLSRGKTGLLVVDEAQNFSTGALCYLMQLPRLGSREEETSLQVIISGQPGVETLLVEAAGEAVAAELSLCRLKSMSTMDTGTYVRHRLRAVSTTGQPTFSDDALDQVGLATDGRPRLVNRLCERILMSAYLDGTRDIDSMRVERAAAELREEMGEPDLPLPRRVGRSQIQADVPGSPPRRSLPPGVGSAGDLVPTPVEALPEAPTQPLAAGNPVAAGTDLPELPKIPTPPEVLGPSHSQASTRRRSPYWGAAAAAGLMVVSFGWLAFDRPNPRDTTRRGTVVPAKVVEPTVGIESAEPGLPPELTAPAAEKSGGALLPDGKSPVRLEASGAREPARPPSQPVDARAALGLAPSGSPASAPPPAAAPSCGEAAKALGLCP
jgi:type II secretory pathway predicted ATPase ExeA